MSHWDVIIVGGGIAGASLGAQIAGRRRTLIIEAESHCGYHSTGRSAAFWLESYGGPTVAPLTRASRPMLEAAGLLRDRGAIHLLRPGERMEVPPAVAVIELKRADLERLVPGIRPKWQAALFEAGCADIDVAGLHGEALALHRRSGGEIANDRRLASARYASGCWTVTTESGDTLTASILVNAAGAWADSVADAAGVGAIGVAPKRRTMVQLRIGRRGLRDLPLVGDAAGTFYFKGEGERGLWLSPHDEIATDPCDAAPDEIDIATAIARFEDVVDWPVERVERSWAGLRSFAPDRVPVYGFDPRAPGFFWCAGQGGFGIQTAPAAAQMASALLLEEKPDAAVSHIDPRAFSPARFV